jgi:TonB family protein
VLPIVVVDVWAIDLTNNLGSLDRKLTVDQKLTHLTIRPATMEPVASSATATDVPEAPLFLFVRDFVAIQFGARRVSESPEPQRGPLVPARFLGGSLPMQPQRTQSGGEVLLELRVGTSGTVTEVIALRTSPPFTELLRQAVQGWRFEPARTMMGERDKQESVEAGVLVAGCFRPPKLYAGAMPGEPPQDISHASPDIPHPTSMATPRYPPDGLRDQVVLVEVELRKDGSIAETSVVRSAPGFDTAALDAARQWRWRPALWRGKTVPAFAYIVFGFREPITVVKP